MGPYASTDIVMPTVASIATAAIPIPYSPATALLIQIAVAIARIGNAVDSSPTARPAMMLVAGPVLLASAIFLTGPADV